MFILFFFEIATQQFGHATNPVLIQFATIAGLLFDVRRLPQPITASPLRGPRRASSSIGIIAYCGHSHLSRYTIHAGFSHGLFSGLITNTNLTMAAT